MASKKENPARAARGVPVVDIAAGKIDPEYASATVALQVARLTRRCALTAAMAAIVAPLLHGEDAR